MQELGGGIVAFGSIPGRAREGPVVVGGDGARSEIRRRRGQVALAGRGKRDEGITGAGEESGQPGMGSVRIESSRRGEERRASRLFITATGGFLSWRGVLYRTGAESTQCRAGRIPRRRAATPSAGGQCALLIGRGSSAALPIAIRQIKEERDRIVCMACGRCGMGNPPEVPRHSRMCAAVLPP